MVKPSRKTLINKLDKAWGLTVRERANNLCEICSRPGNNPHHIIGRRNHSLRWDLKNGICLCAGCHTFGTKSAHQNPLWFLDQLDKGVLEYLRKKQNEIKKWKTWELEELLTTLTSDDTIKP